MDRKRDVVNVNRVMDGTTVGWIEVLVVEVLGDGIHQIPLIAAPSTGAAPGNVTRGDQF
jgi:hypothetical protein